MRQRPPIARAAKQARFSSALMIGGTAAPARNPRSQCRSALRLYQVVIAAAEELHQAEAVTVRIGHERDTPPFVERDVALKHCACAPRALQRRLDVRHDRNRDAPASSA